MSDDPNKVNAQRRRRSTGGPSGRAEMPRRQQPRTTGGASSGGGGVIPPSSGGLPPAGSGFDDDYGSSGSGGGSGLGGLLGGVLGSSGGATRAGKRGGLSCGCIVVLLVVGALVFFFLILPQLGQITSDLSGGDAFETQPGQGSSGFVDYFGQAGEPAPTLAPTRPPSLPTATRDPDRTQKRWTIMLYQDADDQTLEQDIVMDFNEAEAVGSDDNINIVAQIDRYAGGYAGDGNWTGARRYYLTRDNDLFNINSPVVQDLGEVSMADPQTLVDFATWAMQNYPADNYALILSDHGMGWPGGLTDPAGQRSPVSNAFARAINTDMMYTSDVDTALAQILANTGVSRFELVGFDACLMSHLEVYSALAPYANTIVNSQETEPALGWAYAGFLVELAANPGMDGAQLGELIVRSYIEDDLRIQHPQARLDFLRQGQPMSSFLGGQQDISPAQLTSQLERSVTLTAARTDALPALNDAVNQFAYALQAENQQLVAQARTYAQSFTSVFGRNVPPSYIDLGNFAQLLLQNSSNQQVRNTAQQVVQAIDQAVVAEKHGSQKPGATGVSIYFPNSQQYASAVGGPQAYTEVANRFAQESLWDDFLAFHYTRQAFQPTTTGPAVPYGRALEIPGAGNIQVSALRLSASETDYDQPVTLEADLSGENIGYVYLFVGYYDPDSGSILVADLDYLESPQTRRLGDLYYPNWSDQTSFTLSYNWLPTVFAISDGENSAVALLTPERYGASAEDAVYTLDGYYTFASDGERRYARLYFRDGQLQQVMGFNGTDSTGMMREVIPQNGDQFTILQTWMDPDGSGGYTQSSQEGDTLTFSDQMFTWEELYADSGTYQVGFVVTDLDGKQVQTLGQLDVR